jgi:hypothetical protein
MRLFITEADALAAGMTHHGRLFGVPAWVRPTPDGVDGAPKFLPLQAWCWMADAAYEVASRFLPPGAYLVAPMSADRLIRAQTGAGSGSSRG